MQPVHLTEAQIEDVLTQMDNDPTAPAMVQVANGETIPINPDTVDEQSMLALTMARRDRTSSDERDRLRLGEQDQTKYTREDSSQANVDESLQSDDKVLPSGVLNPEGYVVVGVFTSEDGMNNYPVHDLQEEIVVEDPQYGISVVFEQSQHGSRRRTGVIRARLIEDRWARIYIFRKDDKKAGKTYIKTSMGHG